METPPRTRTSPLMEDMIEAVRAKLGPHDRETLIRVIGYCRSPETAVQRCRTVLERLTADGQPAAATANGFPWARPAGWVAPEQPELDAHEEPVPRDDSVTLVRAHLRRRRPRPVTVDDASEADDEAGPFAPDDPEPATDE